jgi:hypothetical protein
MKIDIIENYDQNNPNEKIFRIYDFRSNEVNDLIRLLNKLVANEKTEVDLKAQNYIQSIAGVNLVLECGERDEGISHLQEENFVCRLSKEGWENAIELLKPFAESENQKGFQWLYDLNTGIEMLVSRNGKW